jgi:hypothetical protein
MKVERFHNRLPRFGILWHRWGVEIRIKTFGLWIAL